MDSRGIIAVNAPGGAATCLRQSGTSLKAILANAGMKPSAACGCEAMRQKMNAWGPDGCREHREEIIAHLKKAYGETTWTERAKVGASLLAEPWFRLADPLGSLVDEAIRRAESEARPIIEPD